MVSKLLMLLLLFFLYVPYSVACTASASWESALNFYEEAVAVYSAKISFMKSGDYYLNSLEDVYETDRNDVEAYLNVDKVWKQKKRVEITGLNSMEQRFSVSNVEVEKEYVFYICKNKDKKLSKERYTACEIEELEVAERDLKSVKSYLNGSRRFRYEMSKHANASAIQACLELNSVSQ